MRKIREILRLKFESKLENRQIARSCSIPHSTVANFLRRAAAAGLSWPLSADLSDVSLENQLFPTIPATRETPAPDFKAIHAELLRHKHLTLDQLWQEYKQACPEGYQYSRFCELYRRWAHKLDIVLRQEHRAGEKMFVDHAGPTVPVVDGETGIVNQASVFVAILGASNYTFAEAVWKRDLAKSLLTLYPHLKCLFMSGYTGDVIACKGVLEPGIYFLQKPFSMKELASVVQKTFDIQ